jgi:hypothetical protein
MQLQGLGQDAKEALVQLQATVSQMLTGDDLEDIGEQLANDTTAAVMLYENTWAAKAKQAIMDANGRVVMQSRVPHEVIQQTLDDLAALGGRAP